MSNEGSIDEDRLAPDDWIWYRYHKDLDSFDNAFIEKWKNDLDGVLVFAGLFSAMVAGFFIDSKTSLQPDPASQTVQLLSAILDVELGASFETRKLTPSHSTPSTQSTLANLLFMYSLFFSVTCALAATLLQRWVCMFVQDVKTLPVQGCALGRRRAIAAFGARRFQMAPVAELMAFLLHVSFFLFFFGFIYYLKGVDDQLGDHMFLLVVCMTIVYAVLTACPLIWRESPYQTPLSFILWRTMFIFTIVLTIVARIILKIWSKLSHAKGPSREPPRYYERFKMCLGEFTARARANGQLRVTDVMALVELSGLLVDLKAKERFLRGMVMFLESCGATPDPDKVAHDLPREARKALEYLGEHSAPIISIIESIPSSSALWNHEGVEVVKKAIAFATLRFHGDEPRAVPPCPQRVSNDLSDHSSGENRVVTNMPARTLEFIETSQGVSTRTRGKAPGEVVLEHRGSDWSYENSTELPYNGAAYSA